MQLPLLSLLCGLTFVTFTTAQSACPAGISNVVAAPLQHLPKVQSYCSSKFPATTPTISTNVSTVTLTAATSTVTLFGNTTTVL